MYTAGSGDGIQPDSSVLVAYALAPTWARPNSRPASTIVSRISSRSSYGPQISSAGHAVAQRAHLAPADVHRGHVEHPELVDRPAVEFLDEFPGVRPLDLEAVADAVDGLALRVARRTVVLGDRDIVAAGLPMKLDPVRARRPADENEPVPFEMKQDAVADHVAAVAARHILLGPVFGKVREGIDRRVGDELQRIRTLDVDVDHVMGLVEQDAAIAPGALLVAPVRVFGRDDRIHVGADL